MASRLWLAQLVQTFLPYSDFRESASALDDKRLGKQRVETLQIMGALLEGRGWANHPASKMWRGHEYALLTYQVFICFEWIRRGFKDTCLKKTMNLYFTHEDGGSNYDPPSWLGNHEFHLAHQSNLIRKDPLWYGPQFPGVPNDLPYIWPV